MNIYYLILFLALTTLSIKCDNSTQETKNLDETSGKQIFDSYCSSCHSLKPNEYITGSSLYKIHERRSKKWLLEFTKSNAKMLKKNDSIAIVLYEKTKTVMSDFKQLSKKDLQNLYFYIEQKSVK